jgi:hypothetical protein
MDFNARAEAFLGQFLGGRVEPLPGDRIPGSTAVVKVVAPRTAAGQSSDVGVRPRAGGQTVSVIAAISGGLPMRIGGPQNPVPRCTYTCPSPTR